MDAGVLDCGLPDEDDGGSTGQVELGGVEGVARTLLAGLGIEVLTEVSPHVSCMSGRGATAGQRRVKVH